MDPGCSIRPTRSRGLPRTRGDGPRSSAFKWLLAGAPPHTRGWTAVSPVGTRDLGGSPAHAGMDPSTQACAKCQTGGSPAHAGMDPVATRVQCNRKWLPRTRGDGPGLGVRRDRDPGAPPHTRGWTHRAPEPGRGCLGSPAHAGMDPRPHRERESAARLPRTRGDGPTTGVTVSVSGLAPPHTRGWTRSRSGDGADLRGSPAHAGMDPFRMLLSTETSRLPCWWQL